VHPRRAPNDWPHSKRRPHLPGHSIRCPVEIRSPGRPIRQPPAFLEGIRSHGPRTRPLHLCQEMTQLPGDLMVLAGPTEIWEHHHATGTMRPDLDGGRQDIIQVMAVEILVIIPVMVAVILVTIQDMAVAVDIIQAVEVAVILDIIQEAVVVAILATILAQHLLGATIRVAAAVAVVVVAIILVAAAVAAVVVDIIQAVAAVILAIILAVEVIQVIIQALHLPGVITQAVDHPRKLPEEDGCTRQHAQLLLQQPGVHLQTITGPVMEVEAIVEVEAMVEVEAIVEVEVLADLASGDNDQCFQTSS